MIADINSTFIGIYGWSKNEVIGESLTIIIPPEFRDAHHLGFSRFLSTGEPTIMGKEIKVPVLTKNGNKILSVLFLEATQSENQWTFQATLKPVTSN
jgi:PAS domain S-box-containing protein